MNPCDNKNDEMIQKWKISWYATQNDSYMGFPSFSEVFTGTRDQVREYVQKSQAKNGCSGYDLNRVKEK